MNCRQKGGVMADIVVDSIRLAIDVATGFLPFVMSGDLGLLLTFWALGVLLGSIGPGLSLWLLANVMQIFGERSMVTAYILLSLFVMLLLFWTLHWIAVVVGVWRAAGAYPGPVEWAVVAKIVVVLLALSWLGVATSMWAEAKR